ncbi:methyltransferase domain-containing protein [Heliobacterium gestii]|uniref:Methyltransferase domain-containing protein n=1 Tax=Heliomicrobium gestii TaxID=2699 RepID=A0A845LAW4_HELGE|nr:class I SAM-dependent methyltransferase [Heliomicrobium gestii]MBM7865829.1 SAM-dependent methyltransferase [Heliomicrobium gestii]MZP42070.1 methyltransferase domain-containing protein [Heliomicrobium gestii]
MDEQEQRRMWAEEEDHWWYRGKRMLIRDQLIDALSTEDQRLCRTGAQAERRLPRILDIGCGSGRTMAELGDLGHIEGVEPCRPAVEQGRRRGFFVHQGSAERLPFVDETFDALLLLDVLEHLDDDGAALAEAFRVLRPGGLLLLTVPAHPWLFSRHDSALGHRRRYSAADLRRLLTSLDGHVERFSYTNFFIFPAAVLLRTAAKGWGSDRRGGGSPLVSAWLDRFYRIEARWLRRFAFPAGLSLYARLRKGSFSKKEG